MPDEPQVTDTLDDLDGGLPAEPAPVETDDAALEAAPADDDDARHPLEPGGKRWNQVYRRAKDAERAVQEHRERVAALEAEVRLLRESRQQTTPDEKVYTGAELQQMIDEGKATVGQAIEYARKTGQQAAVKEIQQELDRRDQLNRETGTVRGEIDRYVTLLPGLSNADSDETRKAYDAYRDLVNVWGEPKDELSKQRLQLTALKTAFGTTSNVESRMRRPSPPTHTETTTGTGGAPRQPAGDNWWNKLPQAERDHYTEMLKQGVYRNMDEVKAEVEWYTTKYDRTRKRVTA